MTNPAPATPSATKRAALGTFRLLRRAGARIGQIPVITREAARDVAEAWRESAHPDSKPFGS